MNDSADGLDAIVKLAKHPDGKGLSADDFSAPRDNLSEDEQSAPDHLKKYLGVQVESWTTSWRCSAARVTAR